MLFLKHTACLITSVLLFSLSGNAQKEEEQHETDKEFRNSISLELGGPSFFYSLNYEYSLSFSERTQFNFGAGLSYFAFDPWTQLHILSVPFASSIAFGSSKNKFETGLGIVPFLFNGDDFAFAPNLSLGYRFEGDNRFLLKIGAVGSLMIDPDPNAVYTSTFIWPKFSFGYRF